MIAVVGVVVTALAACSPQPDAPPAPAPASPPVPVTIERLSRVAFPADGAIHVQRRGRIVIAPTTPVCFYPDGFWIETSNLFGALGQQTTRIGGGGGDRQDPAVEGRCDFSGDVVLTRGVRLPNRNGTPYKLVLAVWQGDVDGGQGAYWVGVVERLEGRIPDYFVSIDGPTQGIPRNTQAEERYFAERHSSEDQRRIGQSFIASLLGGEP